MQGSSSASNGESGKVYSAKHRRSYGNRIGITADVPLEEVRFGLAEAMNRMMPIEIEVGARNSGDSGESHRAVESRAVPLSS